MGWTAAGDLWVVRSADMTTSLATDLLPPTTPPPRAPLQVMIKDKALCFRACTVKSIKEHQAVVFDEE